MNKMIHRSSVACLLSAALLTFGTLSVSTSAQAADKLSDAQIAQVVATANQADIDAAKIAQSKSKNQQVKDLASHMARDHEASNQELKKLGNKKGLKPAESEVSQDIKNDARDASQKLEQAKASEFDRQYVDHEVAFHQKVLDQLKGTLIPNAKDAQVKSLLVNTVPTIEQHLAHAKSMQKNMQQAGQVPSAVNDAKESTEKTVDQTVEKSKETVDSAVQSGENAYEESK